VEVRPESERTLDDADVHLLQKRIAAMVESKVRIFTKLSAEAFHEEGICNMGARRFRLCEKFR
ncbi:hypothetical protein FOZ63_010154, partial [Perkinsus olseni]